MALIVLALSSRCFAETPTSTAPAIEKRMSRSELEATGLARLTRDELESLNRWLRTGSIAAAENDPQASAPQFSDPASTAKDAGNARVASRLRGDFTGWDGSTRFELENDQVWQQSEPGTYSSRRLANPEVQVERGLLGNWRLQIDGVNRRVNVRRIR
jgi:hypothetical protein